MCVRSFAGPAGGRDRARGRRRRVVAAVAVVLVAGAFVPAWTGSGGALPVGDGGAWPLFGLVGLATRDAGTGDIERLTAKIERFEAGEEVEFSTDREDEIGDLYEAVEGLAASVCGGDDDGGTAEGAGPADDRVVAGGDRDVSERADRERELERTRDMLEQSQRLARVGAWEIAVNDGRPVSMSWTDEVYRIHDLPVGADVDLDTAIDFYHPDDRATVQQTVERAIRDGRPYEFEARLVTAEDELRWVQSIGDPVVEDSEGETRSAGRTGVGDGEVVAVRGSVQDITERKERERQLRERERELVEYREFTDDILDAVDDVFYIVDESGTVLRWNESLREVTGYTDAEIAGLSPTDFVDDDHVPDIVGAIAAVFETGDARVEAPIRTKDGETVPYEFVASRVETPDGRQALAGIGRDVSERVERERELTRTRDLLEQAGRIAGVGGWEVDLTAEPYEVTWTDELFRLYGLPVDTDVDLTRMLEFLHPDDRPLVRAVIEEVLATGEGYDMETRLVTAGGTEKWVRAIGEPVFDDGRVVAVRGSVQDVTAGKERETALTSLHDAARALLGTETDAEAAQIVVAAAEDVLDVTCVGVYTLDADSNRLEPVATTAAFDELCGGAPAVSAGDETSLLWNCFVSGTPTVVDDTTDFEGGRVFGEEVGGGLLVPVGDHGVFVVASETSTVDHETRQLVETLVATIEAAFDRIRTERALRERDAELEARNRRLQRQIAVTEVIRRVDESLVGASSREEIEAAVTERLADTDDVAFAWVGGLDAAGRLEPRSWAGTGGEYLDAITLSTDGAVGPGDAEPAVEVASTREPTVVGNVVDHLQATDWARSAVSYDLHSVVAVPLTYEGYFYGVLAVYADEPDAFGDLERTVFAELGESIAHSVNAVETRRALGSDTVVELALRVADPEDTLGRLARETGGTVASEGLATHGEGESRLFVTVSGADTSAIASTLDGLVSVREYRLVDEDEGLFELGIESETFPSRLVRHGARPQSLTVGPQGAEAVVRVPTGTDVREFVATLEAAHPGLELVSRRTVERDARTRGELVSSLFDDLTDRQLEVLRTAFFAGFFEWPRASTGEDVAEMLGVSQPTVNRHLRLAQQRLFARMFEGETAGT